MEGPFDLVGCAIQRLISGRVSTGLCLLLMGGSLLPLALDHLIASVDKVGVHEILSGVSVLLLTVIAFAVILVGFWKLERATADYQDRAGDFFAWIGWGTVAYSPIFFGAIMIHRTSSDGEPYYLESAYAVCAAFLAPLLVHASGRAIDQHGPLLTFTWNYWSARYFHLFFA